MIDHPAAYRLLIPDHPTVTPKVYLKILVLNSPSIPCSLSPVSTLGHLSLVADLAQPFKSCELIYYLVILQPSSLQADSDVFSHFPLLLVRSWELIQKNMAKCLLFLHSLAQAKT